MSKTKDTATAKDRNRRIRKEALREKLAAGGHLQHVVEIAAKLSDEGADLDQLMVTRLKAAADIKLKLIGKYLPDLKSIELEADGDDDSAPVVFRVVFENGSRSKDQPTG